VGKGTTFLLCTKDIRVALLKRLWLKNLASSGPGMRTGSLCAGHALHDLDTIPVAYAVGKRGNGLHSFFWRSFPPCPRYLACYTDKSEGEAGLNQRTFGICNGVWDSYAQHVEPQK
jgi:hypothetical protein